MTDQPKNQSRTKQSNEKTDTTEEIEVPGLDSDKDIRVTFNVEIQRGKHGTIKRIRGSTDLCEILDKSYLHNANATLKELLTSHIARPYNSTIDRLLDEERQHIQNEQQARKHKSPPVTEDEEAASTEQGDYDAAFNLNEADGKITKIEEE